MVHVADTSALCTLNSHEAAFAPAGTPRVLDDPVGVEFLDQHVFHDRGNRAALQRVGLERLSMFAALLFDVATRCRVADLLLDWLLLRHEVGSVAHADDNDAVVDA